MALKKYLIPVEEHKEIVEFTNQQLKVFWLPDEVKVEKDIHDVLTNFSEAERHGTITTLKLFSIYELLIGDEFWNGRFLKMFEDYSSEFHRMGAVFAMVELAIHAPFYNKINQLLHLDKPEFYLSYEEEEVLRLRIDHIQKIINHENPLVSLGTFSMVEGVVLYSSFAFLKHFQSRGKNKLINVVRGINFSLRDENFHALASAWCYNFLAKDRPRKEVEEAEKLIIEGAKKIFEHESKIMDMVFEKGEIEGITKDEIITFVKSRINECLLKLNIKPIYEIGENPIAEWFYKAINDYSFNDFFSGIGNQYHRNWDETAFSW